RIDGVRRDRERGRVADEIRPRIRSPVDERLTLRPRVAQERVPPAPAADLQKLLAEHALEHAPRQPLLVRETAPPERRAEPIADRLQPAGRAVGHEFDSSSVRAGRPAAGPLRRPRAAPEPEGCRRTETPKTADRFRLPVLGGMSLAGRQAIRRISD